MLGKGTGSKRPTDWTNRTNQAVSQRWMTLLPLNISTFLNTIHPNLGVGVFDTDVRAAVHLSLHCLLPSPQSSLSAAFTSVFTVCCHHLSLHCLLPSPQSSLSVAFTSVFTVCCLHLPAVPPRPPPAPSRSQHSQRFASQRK